MPSSQALRLLALAAPAALALAAASARAEDARIQVLDIRNQTTTCRDVSLADGKLLCADAGGGSVPIPCDEVAEVVFPREAVRPAKDLVRFEFTDGSVIYGEVAEAAADGLTVKSPDLGIVREVRFEQLDRILFPGAETVLPPGEKAESEDVVWKRNKDSDRGYVRSLEAKGLGFESTLFKKTAVLPLEELAAVLFQHSAGPPAEGDRLLAILSGNRGTRVTGILKDLSRGQVVLETLYGVTLTVPGACVASIYFKNGRCVYLSDLTPTRVVERPFFEVAGSDQVHGPPFLFPFRRDQSVAGGKLALKGKEYRKGLGVHAYCELEYALGGKFERFLAVAGIDDGAVPTDLCQPSVRFRVLVDGKPAWESDLMLWTSAPQPLEIPVAGASALTLIVDYADDGDSLDRAVWAAARLIR